MNEIDLIAKLLRVAADMGRIDLKAEILDVKEQLLDRREEVIRLRTEVLALRERIALKEDLRWDKSLSSYVGDTPEDRFCKRCIEEFSRRVRLVSSWNFRLQRETVRCTSCNDELLHVGGQDTENYEGGVE